MSFSTNFKDNIQFNPKVSLKKLGWRSYFSKSHFRMPITVLENRKDKGLYGFYSIEARPLEKGKNLNKELKDFCKNLDGLYKKKQGMAKVTTVNKRQLCSVKFVENKKTTIQYLLPRQSQSGKSYTIHILTFTIDGKKRHIVEIEKLAQGLL